MTAAMTRDERTDVLVAELDRLRQLKRLEDALRAVSEATAALANQIDAFTAAIPTSADDGLCPTCNEPMAYYHGPGTESGRTCTYCDDGIAWSYDTDWDAA